MPIKFGNTEVKEIIYNGVNLDKVIYNGVVVFQKVTDIYNNNAWNTDFGADFGAAASSDYPDGRAGSFTVYNPLYLANRAMCVVGKYLKGTVTIKFSCSVGLVQGKEISFAQYKYKPSTKWDTWDWDNRVELLNIEENKTNYVASFNIDGYLRIEADLDNNITIESITIS